MARDPDQTARTERVPQKAIESSPQTSVGCSDAHFNDLAYLRVGSCGQQKQPSPRRGQPSGLSLPAQSQDPCGIEPCSTGPARSVDSTEQSAVPNRSKERCFL